MDHATAELIGRLAALEAIQAEREREEKRKEKEAQSLRKIYFLLDKAEDEIVRHTALLDNLNEQRDDIEAQLRTVCERISVREFDPHIDPRNDAGMETFTSKYESSSGFLRYMAEAEKVNDAGKKSLAAELEKLRRQRSALRSKLDSLDAKIYATEQRIKKAEYEKYEYSVKVGR